MLVNLLFTYKNTKYKNKIHMGQSLFIKHMHICIYTYISFKNWKTIRNIGEFFQTCGGEDFLSIRYIAETIAIDIFNYIYI